MKVEETINAKVSRKMKSEAEEYRKTHWYSYDNIKNNGGDLSNLKFYTDLEMDEHGELCREEERDRIKECVELISYNNQLHKYELLDFDDIIEIIDKEGGR